MFLHYREISDNSNFSFSAICIAKSEKDLQFLGIAKA